MTSGKQRKKPARGRSAGATSPAARRDGSRAVRLAAEQRAQERRQLVSWLAAGIVIAIVAVAALIIWNGLGDDDGGNERPGNMATIVPGDSIDSSIQMNDMTLGNADAPITVVEYGDYQCPFCVRFQRNDMDSLTSDYIQSGKVRFEYREYPIIDQKSDGSFDTEGESFRAAEAAMCANDQGQYWPYHNLLFANSHGEFVGSFTIERLKQMAAQTPGVDTATFIACVDDRTHTATVQAMATEAFAAGIGSTPTFVINGRPVEGADFGTIKDVIEEQLAEP